MKKRVVLFLLLIGILLSIPVGASFTYKDPDSGVSFTVPSGYTQKAPNEDQLTISVKFLNDSDKVSSIMFGAVDLWDVLDEEDLIGCTREDINMSMPDVEDLAEAISGLDGGLELVTYNGTKYYHGSATLQPLTIQYNVYIVNREYYITIDYGYIYCFQSAGQYGVIPSSVMTDLLKSAEYVKHPSSGSGAASRGKSSFSFNGGGLFLSLLITIAAYCAFPLLFAKLHFNPIKRKSYRWLCYGINFAIALIFCALESSSSTAGAFSFGPYLLWTFVFSKIGTNMLRGKGLLMEPGQPDPQPAADSPDDMTETDSRSRSMPAEEDDTPCELQNEEVLREVPEDPDPGDSEIESVVSDASAIPMKFCRFCGKRIPIDSKFCRYCGKEI